MIWMDLVIAAAYVGVITISWLHFLNSNLDASAIENFFQSLFVAFISTVIAAAYLGYRLGSVFG